MSDTHIDWSAIHRLLEKLGAAIEEGFSPGPEEKKKILRARAELLAGKPGAELTGDTLEVVEFILAGERYGIESSFVREVYPLKEYTPLPCTPSFVLGLFNLRGQILSVIDIGKFFELPAKGITDLNKVIVIHSHNMEFGILADSIHGVRNIAAEDIQSSLPTLTGIRGDFLKGVTKEQMVILDAEKILQDKNLVVHEQA